MPTVRETEFAALDLETTGLDPLNDRIVEAAAVIFRGHEVLDSFETLVNPGVRITPALTAIHGINNSMVKGAPSPVEAVGRLAGFVGERPLVIQNAPFDLGFMETVRQENFQESLVNDVFDTCRMAPLVFPGLPGYSLGSMARSLKVAKGRDHRALDDSLAAMGIFLKCLEKIDPDGRMGYGIFERSWSLTALMALERTTLNMEWPEGFELLKEARESSGRVLIVYRGGNGTITERVIEPTGLVRIGGRIMLEAWCGLRGESRTFRFDRILEIRPQEK